jgi:hypothetical protein
MALRNLAIHVHAVHFEPEQEREDIRRALLREHAASLGQRYTFDGESLYTFDSIGNEAEPLVFNSVNQTDQSQVTITVTFTRSLPSTNPQFLQASLAFFLRHVVTHMTSGTSVHAHLRF